MAKKKSNFEEFMKGALYECFLNEFPFQDCIDIMLLYQKEHKDEMTYDNDRDLEMIISRLKEIISFRNTSIALIKAIS